MLTLLISLQFCHFLADFTHLSRPWMLKAKATGSPAFPIFCHAMVHTILMTITLSVYFEVIKKPYTNENIIIYLSCILLQLFSHTLIDVCKGKLNRFAILKNPMSPWHWWIFGLDQYCHFLVIVWMVYLCT